LVNRNFNIIKEKKGNNSMQNKKYVVVLDIYDGRYGAETKIVLMSKGELERQNPNKVLKVYELGKEVKMTVEIG
jgi:hypothetical protein